MKEEQIINSARELFEKYGIRKTSMDEIAKNANVTKKTVYSYFHSKDDLINYFIKEELLNMKKIVEQYEYENQDFFENVHKGLYALLNYKQNSRLLSNFIKEAETLDLKSLKNNLEKIDNEIKDFISGVIKKAKDKGFIKDVNIDVVTFLIYKMYIALILDLDEDVKKLNDKEIADSLLQILKNGISK